MKKKMSDMSKKSLSLSFEECILHILYNKCKDYYQVTYLIIQIMIKTATYCISF